jgi:hypothetical protein
MDAEDPPSKLLAACHDGFKHPSLVYQTGLEAVRPVDADLPNRSAAHHLLKQQRQLASTFTDKFRMQARRNEYTRKTPKNPRSSFVGAWAGGY